MIHSSKIPKLKEHLDLLRNQLSLLEDKIESSPYLDPQGHTQEEERGRLRKELKGYREQAPEVLKQAEIIAQRKASLPAPERPRPTTTDPSAETARASLSKGPPARSPSPIMPPPAGSCVMVRFASQSSVAWISPRMSGSDA
ncbi:MAG: hypothetical protein ACE5ER_10320 [Nitrospinaceae bacterium]